MIQEKDLGINFLNSCASNIFKIKNLSFKKEGEVIPSYQKSARTMI